MGITQYCREVSAPAPICISVVTFREFCSEEWAPADSPTPWVLPAHSDAQSRPFHQCDALPAASGGKTPPYFRSREKSGQSSVFEILGASPAESTAVQRRPAGFPPTIDGFARRASRAFAPGLELDSCERAVARACEAVRRSSEKSVSARSFGSLKFTSIICNARIAGQICVKLRSAGELHRIPPAFALSGKLSFPC